MSAAARPKKQEDRAIIVVSGYRRTGTSAMMGALFKALKQPAVIAYSPGDESKGNREHDGYSPNPGPLYEVGGHTRNASFLRCQPESVLIKIFFDSVVNLPAGEHTVIFMERDEDEVNASLQRVREHFDKINYVEGQEPCDELAFDVYREYDQDDIDHVIGILEQRRDITLIRVNYADLVLNPEQEFQRIADAGLRLDVGKAAKMIVKEHYRSRRARDDNSTGRSVQRAAHN